MKPDLSIVTPCYNEGDNIPLLLKRFSEVVNQVSYKVEVIFVNNGSFDNSAEIFEKELNNQNSLFRVVNVKENKGYGYGILCGLKEAKSDILSWTHADLQTDPADVIKGYELFKKADELKLTFIKGKRKKRNPIDTFFTFGMGLYSSIKLKLKIKDINAQPKMFHRDFYNKWNKPPYDFSLDLYVYYLAKKMDLRIIELPVYFNKRRYGQAKGGGTFKGKIKLIKRTLKYINELKLTLINREG